MASDTPVVVALNKNSSLDRNSIVVAAVLTLLFLLALLVPSKDMALSLSDYLPLHTTIEVYSVTVAVLVFGLGWSTSRETGGGTSLFLALGFLAVGLLDFAHTLSYQGMPNFITPGSPQKAINFWLAARLTAALVLLALALRLPVTRLGSQYRLAAVWLVLGYVGIYYWIILYEPQWIPDTFIPGQGLTTFKVATEISIVIIHIITALLLWWHSITRSTVSTAWLASAVWIMALSELLFTQYTAVSDWFNLVGHLYKVAAYIIVYYALFVQNVKAPYRRLQQTSRDLELSQARHAAVVSAAMDAVVMIDEDQRICLFNTMAEKMFGYQAAEVLGEPIDILIPKSFRTEHAALIRKFASTGTTARPMGRYGYVSGVRKNGVDFPAEAAISRASANGKQYFIVNVRDTTQQKLAQETIRLSEQRFQTLITNLQGVVYRCELSNPWHVSFISDGTEELTGYKASEFLTKAGIDWADIIHPDDLAMVDNTVKEAVNNGSQYEIQYRIIHKNGTIIWVQEKGISIFEEGKPLYLDGFIHNVTEQKRVEEDQLILKNTAIENSINAIAMANTQGELTYVNQAFLDMWGYDNKQQVLNRSAVEFWSEPEKAAAVIGELEQHGKWSGILHGKKDNGSDFIAQLAASVVYDSKGNMSHMFASFIDVTDRYQAEQQLNTSYQLLDAVFDTTHVLIAVLDSDLNFVRVNRPYAAADNKTPDFFPGKNHFALYPNDENETIFRRAVQTGETVVVNAKPFEYEHNLERGVTHWDWTLTPIKDESGKVTSLVLALLDVTERIIAIENLNARTQELRELNDTLEEKVRIRTNELSTFNEFTETVFNTADALIVVMDRQGRIVRFNHACEQTSGYTTQEVLGKCVWDFLLLPEERDSVKEVFLSLKAGHFPNTHENYWLHKSGQTRWITWANSALTDRHGEVDYIVATGLDITEKRLAESSLRESEFQFRLLAENIEDVFWLTSPDRKIMYYISPAYEKVWGRPVTALYQNPKSFLDAVHEEDIPLLLSDHQAQLDGQFEDHYEREFRIRRPDGTVRWIKSRYSPIYNEQGEVYRVAGISEDITEAKLTHDARLRHEREQRDALVREVHHRIKNNLQGVLGLLRQHTREKPVIRESMDTAITQISTMALVHGLQSSNPGERIQLESLCVAIATSIIGMTGKHIDTRIAQNQVYPVSIQADEAVPLALILNELIFNAVKHSADNERPITLDLQYDEDSVKIVIVNPCNSWEKQPDVMNGANLGTGLSLVRSLMPGLMTVELDQHDSEVQTTIIIKPPVVIFPMHHTESSLPTNHTPPH